MGNLETPLSVDTGSGKCAPDDTACFQFFLPPVVRELPEGRRVPGDEPGQQPHQRHGYGRPGQHPDRARGGRRGHTGAPGEITIVNVKGVKVAVLGFSIYSWGNSLNNIPAATALVKTAAAQADLVVIQMQGGAEGADKSHVVPGHEFFLGEDRGDLIAFSHAVIDAGADVVFGHGPHIMRGMEFYKGRLIAYSLGNFCGYGALNAAGFLGRRRHPQGHAAPGRDLGRRQPGVDRDGAGRHGRHRPGQAGPGVRPGTVQHRLRCERGQISPTDGAISPAAAG